MTEHMSSSAPYSSKADRPSDLVSAREAYTVIFNRLQPSLELLGYSAGDTRKFPWWWVDADDDRLLMSAQVDAKATDPFSGQGFRLEFERGGRRPYKKLTGRALFFQLLPPREYGILLTHQNQIIGSLERPPAIHVRSYPKFLQSQYLSYFQPQTDFDAVQSWLRYKTLEDVDAWMTILTPMIPTLHAQAIKLKSDQIYLGRGNVAELK
jgi:hypothetical protein